MKASIGRPSGANADEWHLYLSENKDALPMLAVGIAVGIAEAIEAEREACAMIHESVNPASDNERLNKVPGAGAMGAVIEYRDLIRKRTK
jgi:hypothetical protein